MAFISRNKNERGATLLEFAIAATVFLTVLFAIVEFGRLFFVHNALRDAARRGARYAALRRNDDAGVLAAKKMVVYGDPNADPGTAQPVVPGLTMANVYLDKNDVNSYKNWNGLQLSSRVQVKIINYNFQFAVPLVGGSVTLPPYRTSMTGESAGWVPCNLPGGSPLAPCQIVPN